MELGDLDDQVDVQIGDFRERDVLNGLTTHSRFHKNTVGFIKIIDFKTATLGREPVSSCPNKIYEACK